MSDVVPSLFKWTGGKRRLAKQIWAQKPQFNTYFEPFLGGGSMLYFGANHPSKVGDLYAPLIDLWKLVQRSPEELIHEYRQRWLALQADLPAYFYDVRARFNKDQNPHDLNFVLRTCVNGIVRFNAAGEFNNSFHLSRKGMEPKRFEGIVRVWSDRIEAVDFKCCDYVELCDEAARGDFVYLDPPYASSKNRYIENLDLLRFTSFLENMNRRGVKWILSFDGTRGDVDYKIDIPKDVYKRRIEIAAGHSAVKKVLTGPSEHVVESLFFNY